ncbi:MAG TPA: FtsH protease activity modulator HflK [Bryobacteraceae bacterium]|jgi:membrane protease subunit HflK|nr:FtsH protease activity modulator HflK [Bryobacteraceae bacterium]
MSTVALQIETGQAHSPPPSKRWTKRRVAGAVIAVWVLSGVYLVAPDQQAVETLFGRVVTPRVMPGLHYALPWPVERVTKLKVRQLQRLVVGGDLADGVLGRTPPLVSQFLTGDQNIINARVVVQYSVGVPADYLFQAQSPAQVVGAAVESEMARRLAHRSVDAVLTTEKAAIQDEVLAAAQKLLNEYRAGVQLSTINIESVTPPPDAAEAFRDVASARADTARIVNDAEGYANDLIPKARGQAQQLLQEAEAYRDRKINEAGGDAARFDQIAAEYAKASQVTGQRLYLETMEQVLPRIKKLIIDKNGNLDLTIIRRGDAAK